MLYLWIAAALAADLPEDVAARAAAAPASLSAEVSAWQPVMTRAQTPRFAGDLSGDRGAVDALMAQRLVAGTDPEAVQGAIVGYLDGAEGLGDLWHALYAERPGLRVAILGTLKHADAALAVALLGEGLRDPERSVREEAARVAGYRQEPALNEPLVAALKDEAASVRRLAARSTGFRGDTLVFDALRPLLQDADADVRRAALRAMSLLDLPATKQLSELAALAADPDPRTVKLAEQIRSR